jgi:hypothetical protein
MSEDGKPCSIDAICSQLKSTTRSQAAAREEERAQYVPLAIMQTALGPLDSETYNLYILYVNYPLGERERDQHA